MAEVVNVLVAFAVIVFLFRWVTSSSDSPEAQSAASALGFRPKNVTQQMIDTVHAMFPDIPTDNIRYDLLRTGSIELTTNKILERGFLDAPPAAYYTVFPRADQQQPLPVPASHPITTSSKPSESLITRYKLQDRLETPIVPQDDVGGKAVWEDSPEKREASLRERKAQMVLVARQRFLEQQSKAASSSKS